MSAEPRADGPDAAEWVTVSELARRKGISKQAISKRLGQFVARGLVETRPGENGAKLVDVAAWDRAAGDTTDLAKAQAVRTVRATRAVAAGGLPEMPAPSLDFQREQTRHKAAQADLAEMEARRRRGELVEVRHLADAASRCLEALLRPLVQLPGRATDCAAAVGRDGVPGARVFLRDLERDLRTTFAAELGRLADLARTDDGSPSSVNDTEMQPPADDA